MQMKFELGEINWKNEPLIKAYTFSFVNRENLGASLLLLLLLHTMLIIAIKSNDVYRSSREADDSSPTI